MTDTAELGKGFSYPPGVIRIPSYALSDAGLRRMRDKIEAVIAETPPDDRDRQALGDIARELLKRERTIVDRS